MGKQEEFAEIKARLELTTKQMRAQLVEIRDEMMPHLTLAGRESLRATKPALYDELLTIEDELDKRGPLEAMNVVALMNAGDLMTRWLEIANEEMQKWIDKLGKKTAH